MRARCSTRGAIAAEQPAASSTAATRETMAALRKRRRVGARCSPAPGRLPWSTATAGCVTCAAGRGKTSRKDRHMDADVQLHGTVLHLTDVRIGKRTLTATLDGRRVSVPKDRLLGQKVLMACERAERIRRPV